MKDRPFDGGEWGPMVQQIVNKRIEEELRAPLPHLFPAWAVDQIAKNSLQYMDTIVFQVLTANQPPWEERLAIAIEQRSIRNRLRRIPGHVRWTADDYRDRITTAVAVLRNKHECGEW